jgi:hypothetical protein
MLQELQPDLMLSDEIVAFVQSGVSIIVGVVGADGRPKTGRALGARFVTAGTVRLIYPLLTNHPLLAAAQSSGQIAVTFSAPLTHRTIQLKGICRQPEPVEPEDIASAEEQARIFAKTLQTVGHTKPFADAYCSFGASELAVLSLSVKSAFEQTPGPGAGRSI